MAITLYGIKSCDSVRKARKFLDNHGIEYQFHDLRQAGLDRVTLGSWLSRVDWSTLLNRRGTTWRQLPENDRQNLDAERAAVLMLNHPLLIKRPVLDTGGQLEVGFSEQRYSALLGRP